MNYSKNVSILAIIILIAAFFRFYNLNWDSGSNMHPDERAIILFTLPLSFPKSLNEFLSPTSPLNPHFFAYGNFPLYLLKSASSIAGNFNPQLTQYDGIQLVGRTLSVLADLMTIFLIYKIGKILFDENVGYASSILYSLSVFPIQASHFYAVDVILTFFITLTIYRLLKLYNESSFLNAALVGFTFGLALVTKISALSLGLAIGFSIVADFLFIFVKKPHRPAHWLPHLPVFLKKLLIDGVIIICVTILTFVILQPYALIDSKEFIFQNLQQSQMTKNAYTFPYTLQYVGKIPYLYEIKNIFLWGQGPIIGIICALGLLIFLLQMKSRDKNKFALSAIVLSFMLSYFLIVGNFAIGFMRYMLPIYPLLSIMGGFFVVSVILKKAQKIARPFRVTLYCMLAILVIIWPASFLAIYQRENTRITASNWINNYIPRGSILTHEIWDDQLPLYTAGNYVTQDLALYDQPDDNTKWRLLNSQINSSDYIIIASNRLYTPIGKLANCSKYKICFPKASMFYKKLFAEKLGFKKIAEFTSYPTIPILNIQINDQTADEAFTVYDHPRVLIFKKNK